MSVADLLAMPGRYRLWRKEKRGWRKRTNTLPPPEPGSEAAKQLAYFRRLRRQMDARSYPVRGWTR